MHKLSSLVLGGFLKAARGGAIVDCGFVVASPSRSAGVDNHDCKDACENGEESFFNDNCMEELYGLDLHGIVQTPGTCFEQWGHGYVDSDGTEELAGIEMWTGGVENAAECQQLCQDHPDCAAFLYRVVTGGGRTGGRTRGGGKTGDSATEIAGNCVLKSAQQITEAASIFFDGTLWNTVPADDPRYDWCNMGLDFSCTTPGYYDCLTCTDEIVCAYHSDLHVSGPKYCGNVWECGVSGTTTTPPPATTPAIPCHDDIHLELALLMDASHSFEDDLPVLKIQFPELMHSLQQELNGRSKFAFGSFIDKPIHPFGWDSDYCISFETGLTYDSTLIEVGLNRTTIGGGYDFPEGSLDALLDFAWRPEMRWSEGDVAEDGRKIVKIIALSTDAAYHQGGETHLPERKLGPLDCTGQDYPFVPMVAQQLKEKHILPLFMVTEVATKFFETLQAELAAEGVPSEVRELEEDSSNIFDLIMEVIAAVCDLDLTPAA